MERRTAATSWAAVVVGLGIAGFGCATAVSSGGEGGSGGETAVTTTSSPGGAGGEGGQAPDGTCSKEADCAYLTQGCVVGACLNGMCTTFPGTDGVACEDGLFCTANDVCQNGVCVSGNQKVCPPSDACHIGTCDEITKGCSQAPGNNGAQCDDGDSCTYFGTCVNGTCNKGPEIDCSIFDSICGVGVCVPGTGCVAMAQNDGFPCDDGQFCTEADSCQGGICTGGPPKACAPPGGCFIGTCDEINDKCSSVAGNDGAACDDGSPCTDNTTCSSGLCANGTPTNDGAACDDGTGCTMGEFCTAGTCGGGTGPTVYFAENFADNAKGWLLGTEWAIGPTTASMGEVYGFPDPISDHTSTADNGVAGVVLGGNASTTLHDFYYLESPAFDTSSAAGPVIFGYYRHLSSDYLPYMQNTVDVWDGSTWINVWMTGGSPGIQDADWTYMEHDLTVYKNAQMRVRFGFMIGSGGVYTVSQWNVDDVLVASAGCP